MTQSYTIWSTLQQYMPRGKWVSIGEIYTIFQSHSVLDVDDVAIQASHTPNWKFNVRRVLDYKKRAGEIRGRKKQQVGE
jgi:hypothetical protein